MVKSVSVELLGICNILFLAIRPLVTLRLFYQLFALCSFQHCLLPQPGRARYHWSDNCCAIQVLGFTPTEDNPAVLQQWVPQSIAEQVKMVKVTDIPGSIGGAQQLPLIREVVAVDFGPLRAQSGGSRSSARLPPARASTVMLRQCGEPLHAVQSMQSRFAKGLTHSHEALTASLLGTVLASRSADGLLRPDCPAAWHF